MEQRLYEDEGEEHQPDPDETPVRDRKLHTQPYDLNISSLVDQIKKETLHLRPLSDRPRFQRKYVWPNRLASLLIESILLNIPIPPCYFSQNAEFELDVIDGQQRIYSIFRFINNEFTLSGLEVISEINGKRFHQLDHRQQRQIETHTLRAVIITNDSHPEIQFDVFERLNTHTMPLNSQELRNCMFRGHMNNLLGELAEYQPWLSILGRKEPDKRLRDEELILRFIAFHVKGLKSYRTPQKHWLNEIAKEGRNYAAEKIDELRVIWKQTITNCLIVFPPQECFRRSDPAQKRRVINRALMDLVMIALVGRSEDQVHEAAADFSAQYTALLEDAEFQDLISRAIDHKSRTLKRFAIWKDRLIQQVF
jgi:Protein of unknown function DUF262